MVVHGDSVYMSITMRYPITVNFIQLTITRENGRLEGTGTKTVSESLENRSVIYPV